MRTTNVFGIVLIVLVSMVAVPPAQAACGAPFLITSINTDAGNFAYVINPTVTPGAGGDGLDGSTITGALTGFFWAVGFGDPAPGVGADNGTFPALSWMYIYPDYPASVLTTWAADTGIDTCIDVMGSLGQRCQATLIQDVDAMTGAGMFALVSTADDPASGDFFMDNGGMNLTLAPMPQVTITGSSFPGEGFIIDLSVRGPSVADITPGAYLSADPACEGAGVGGADPSNGLVQGWNMFFQILERGSQPPTDFNVGNWADSGLGTQFLGAEVNVSIDCAIEERVIYLAWQLVTDSDFESPLLSSASTRIECTRLIADPDRVREAPQGRQAPRTRQR